jgi:hypothetical protein
VKLVSFLSFSVSLHQMCARTIIWRKSLSDQWRKQRLSAANWTPTAKRLGRGLSLRMPQLPGTGLYQIGRRDGNSSFYGAALVPVSAKYRSSIYATLRSKLHLSDTANAGSRKVPTLITHTCGHGTRTSGQTTSTTAPESQHVGRLVHRLRKPRLCCPDRPNIRL